MGAVYATNFILRMLVSFVAVKAGELRTEAWKLRALASKFPKVQVTLPVTNGAMHPCQPYASQKLPSNSLNYEVFVRACFYVRHHQMGHFPIMKDENFYYEIHMSSLPTIV